MISMSFFSLLGSTTTFVLFLFSVLLSFLLSYVVSRKKSPPRACPMSQEASIKKEKLSLETSSNGSGCPFAGVKEHNQRVLQEFKEKKAKVIDLYEEYVHLPPLIAIWNNPVTVYPRMEPYFAAACHGLELAFLLIAEFLNDSRHYIVKGPRVELVCKDIVAQCQLLAELLDGELEDTQYIHAHQTAHSHYTSASLSATGGQYHGSPPVIQSQFSTTASPGLEMLIAALQNSMQSCSEIEKTSLKKLVRHITDTFNAYFGAWKVGLGIESQIQMLTKVVGLYATHLPLQEHCLDYALLVRPQAAADTLTKEHYHHAEDFFFRTVHLGTECWAYIAISRINAAKEYTENHNWLQAAAQVRYAASIISYLGDHILMLTNMVLRDYLELKVEIQGTSGEGSIAVKSFRSLVVSLLEPIAQSLLPDIPQPTDAQLKEILAVIFARPDSFPGLYEYCKALECIESALLGGFYYKHFLLASNVIGSTAKGTMNKSVEALKVTFSIACFPLLDSIRAELGLTCDAQFAHNSGRIMRQIEERKSNMQSPKKLLSSEKTVLETPQTLIEKCRQAERAKMRAVNGRPSTIMSSKERDFSFDGLRRPDASIVWQILSNYTLPTSMRNLQSNSSSEGIATLDAAVWRDPAAVYAATCGLGPEEMAARDRARRAMYSDNQIPKELLNARSKAIAARKIPDLQFLGHNFAKVPSKAIEQCSHHLFTQYSGLGNFSLDALREEVLPEAVGYIQNLLGLQDSNASVQFGNNHSELVTQLMTATFSCSTSDGANERGVVSDENTETDSEVIRIVTSDVELSTLKRQLHRIIESDFCGQIRRQAREDEGKEMQDSQNRPRKPRLDICVVSASPYQTFITRLASEILSLKSNGKGRVDLIYISQMSHSQETLIPNIPTCVELVRGALGDGNGIIVVDAYNGSFGALPTSLKGVDAVYLGGALKQLGAGANLAFAVFPSLEQHCHLKEMLAKQLYDTSSATSSFAPPPAFLPSMLLFNEVMRLWQMHNISVHYVHAHVLKLQQRFLLGLKNLQKKGRNSTKLVTVDSHNPMNDATSDTALIGISRLAGLVYEDRLHIHLNPVQNIDPADEEQIAIAYAQQVVDATAALTRTSPTSLLMRVFAVSHTLVFVQDSASDAVEAVQHLRGQNIAIDCSDKYVFVGFGLNHHPEDVDVLLEALAGKF